MNNRLTFTAGPAVDTPWSTLAAFGAYIAAETPLELTALLSRGNVSTIGVFNLSTDFTRVGFALSADEQGPISLELSWAGGDALDVWGLDIGFAAIPDGITHEDILEAGRSIVPETYYLDHAIALNADLAPSTTSVVAEDGGWLHLKKCSYCGRLLPINMNKLGSLAFHKHNAKRTHHQNECRSCKKWRINDNFNPARTVDQLHESSVITRERKIFLQESSILQEIKKRTGEGLKSQVWERFDRRCFNCKKGISLNQVQLDHTRPLAYLWPIDEHATCLCAECNNNKKDRFPVDFYSELQLRELSRICGLPYGDLVQKCVNMEQLERVANDIIRYATTWEPRTFFSVARKVQEIHPEIRLGEQLQRMRPEIYEDLLARAAAVRLLEDE
ncbi:HNH endonuclease signature motif containing protein [[Kitasatospora] papulosa]|uniref:HNH endonuclease n=1 Tax=Streptomyces TaxID=1883 RepID=UPI002E7843CB|nr:HNH endonuclease signature motif containing protein [Streptomyces sp. JV181]MEE1780424.1 HNH endonuclease signature motif containing protein [Streptomyces sp. JV181]